MLQLSSEQRRQLRAQAHGLNPVVAIAQQGLTESVLKEIDACLKAHELIKIRVYGDDREARESFLQTICDTLEAAPVQHIGKLLVVWRSRPEGEQEQAPRRSARPAPRPVRRSKRSYQ